MGACLEIGQFGLDGEIEQLRRDRGILVAEIVKLRQQQLTSRSQLATMEERLRGTERKQQQMMAFLARALNNPTFVQQLIRSHEQKKGTGLGASGRKRRLTVSASTDNLQEEVISAMSDSTVSYPNQAVAEEQVIESEIQKLFTTMDNIASSSSIDQTVVPNSMVEAMAGPKQSTLSAGNDITWEELLNEELIAGNLDDEGDQTEIDMEDLAVRPFDWGDDVNILVEQMGFLGPDP